MGLPGGVLSTFPLVLPGRVRECRNALYSAQHLIHCRSDIALQDRAHGKVPQSFDYATTALVCGTVSTPQHVNGAAWSMRSIHISVQDPGCVGNAHNNVYPFP